MTDNNQLMPFDFSGDETPSIIKVIGVGGGGGNAVNHMYKEGIHGVTFALCNTDNQALAKSPIPVKLQLGPTITHGLGAGNNPPKAKDAAEESIEDIKHLLSDGTQMVFITAGMGGGTGTGAAPVVARVAKEMNILTVGIVTIPFLFEGKEKIIQAIEGVEQIKQNVDALMIINNERLRSIYSDLTFINAFTKADDTLSIAAKSIVEIITEQGIMNLDFADVSTTLRNGGVAIISTGLGDGDNRVEKAIQDALHSPLLNNTDIVNAQKVLINLTFSESANFMMDEVGAIHDFMKKLNPNVKVIWGYATDNSLDTSVKITLLASGFDVKDFAGEEITDEIEDAKQKKITDVYGADLISGIQRARAKKRHLYIFSPEDLDNDDIISMVEMSPTYQRDKATLDTICSKAVVETEAFEEDASDENSRIITF
ncbi:MULTISPECIES: cell division protein FtsZ [unclassified Bacteroides]|jgi:cell division protein FtsZ|uniref:cell division protein FtsZ n=1 Tax=unclassified Bacteroides TaxID=2646097 RepID=UPI000E955825|nr:MULTISPECIES: cell division protein FtsZ [unclassified Bacteroides]RGN47043.1 cell division protein FtsZ [Bacteroides sp. OM05-12]RHR77335.1 cell division protein FtsZ [Bacteroides sp. AF16-49]